MYYVGKYGWLAGSLHMYGQFTSKLIMVASVNFVKRGVDSVGIWMQYIVLN